jgi:tetratricopeptide (TPR) repeat protein
MRTTAVHLCIAALVTGAVFAHEGPEHEIEELTERMMKHGESADLLTERAIEYRVMGKLAEATKDLERAAVLDPNSIATHRELGRVLFLGGKPADAISTVTRGLKLESEEPGEIASLLMLRAEVLRSQKEDKKALVDCDAGLRLYKTNPEWYLLRSDIQRRLKLHKDRLAGIEEGFRETGAGVLEIERVEAMMDAGQFAAALKIIQAELDDSRIKSSWLIRRARARIGLGKKEEAETDLKDALAEIAKRLNPKTPDGPLLLDKALAFELLGEEDDALRTYREARDKGAADIVNEKIKALDPEERAKEEKAREEKAKEEKAKSGGKP